MMCTVHSDHTDMYKQIYFYQFLFMVTYVIIFDDLVILNLLSGCSIIDVYFQND